MERPVISFLTDFGPDSAAAICRGVMLSIARDAQIVDISHSVRKYAIADGAYLLTIALPWMPIGVHVAVVDPGVGTDRRPIAIRTGRGDALIGPDNGLLVPAADALGGIADVRVIENRAWMLSRTSSTFHGRDIFAPVAANLALGGRFENVGTAVAPDSLVRLVAAEPVARDGGLDSSVLYVDSFGNLRLAGDPGDLARAVGELTPGRELEVEFGGPDGARPLRERAQWARTFGAIPVGAPLVYEDSFGQLAYADNQGNVAARLGVAGGRPVRISPRTDG
ncbi:MAG TPA: SAM-dependent chlorinase/fluorinase [Candidatus Eisenbacteria bacterium]|nr:SAM-dependent chlorinase/fluorinase [Candidatus Eisenbacteria bacterium]